MFIIITVRSHGACGKRLTPVVIALRLFLLVFASRPTPPHSRDISHHRDVFI
jgi:hypothetical protein